MFLDKNSIYMDNISMGQYLLKAKYGYHKLWSSDSGRTLSGKMTGTLKGIFPKITLTFKKLEEEELELLAPHFDNANQTIKYRDPNKKQMISIETYSGDWETEYKNIGKAESFDLAFISVDRRI